MAKRKMIKDDKDLPQKVINGEISIDELSDEQKELLASNGTIFKTVGKNKDALFYSKGRPTKAQMLLLEKYKINHPNQVVKNSLNEMINEELPNMEEAINNLKLYGDSSIYSVLPKDLDDFIRDYHLIITEYFGKTKKDLSDTSLFVVPQNYRKCSRCGKYKSSRYFYSSTSDISDGYTSVCKDCANELLTIYYKKFNGDFKEALFVLLQKLDLFIYQPVLKEYLEFFKTEDGKLSFVQNTFLGNMLADNYLQMKSANISDPYIGFSNIYLNGIPFKCSEKYTFVEPVYNEKLINSKNNEENLLDEDDIPDSKWVKLERKWGLSDRDELRYIQSCEDRWYSNYEVKGSNRELLVNQICYEELNLWRLRRKNTSTSSTESNKIWKNLKEMMSEANLTPKKSENETMSNKFSSIAEAIKIFEKEKAFVNKDPFFVDVDNIRKIEDSMSGALHRTLGLSSEYISKFEENYKEHKVDIVGVSEDE